MFWFWYHATWQHSKRDAVSVPLAVVSGVALVLSWCWLYLGRTCFHRRSIDATVVYWCRAAQSKEQPIMVKSCLRADPVATTLSLRRLFANQIGVKRLFISQYTISNFKHLAGRRNNCCVLATTLAHG